MVVLDFMRNKRNTISKKIYSIVLKLVKKHHDKVSNSLNNKLLKAKANQFISSEFINKKVENSLNNINKLENKWGRATVYVG